MASEESKLFPFIEWLNFVQLLALREAGKGGRAPQLPEAAY